MMKTKRILVLQLKRIGDFILTVPALDELRARFPKAEIVLAVTGAVESLALRVPAVDRVMVLRSGRLNFEFWATACAGAWDICLDFTGTDRSRLLVLLSRAKTRVGYEKFSKRFIAKSSYHLASSASVRDLHTVDFHLRLVEELDPTKGDESEPRSSGFLVEPSISSRAQRLRMDAGSLAKFAIVHIGTAREEKFWLDERWVEVIRCLKLEWDLDVLLTGSGEGLEARHLKAVQAQLDIPVCDLTGQLALVELLALIQSCELIVGVDSMAMHLAATLKKKQVALYGPTNPYHWRPRHENALVLVAGQEEPATEFGPRAEGTEMKELSTTSVLSAIRLLLSQTT